MVSQFYDLTCLDRRGQTYSFSELKGKVVLIVNVASKCGFTPQYDGLQKLYEEFKDKDFIIRSDKRDKHRSKCATIYKIYFIFSAEAII